MKNYSRAFRRWKKEVNFKRRVNNWLKGTWSYSASEKEEWKQRILSGKDCTFLRTTGNPCNCWMCSGYDKYERIPKFKINKNIWDDIQDNI